MEKDKVKGFDHEGHRGCRGLMPENTIPAMIKALDLGVTTLEMDAVITKDKQVVLSHEPFFNHEITTKADGSYIKESEERSYNIYQMNFNEVQKFDVGLKPHPRFPRQAKIAATKPRLAEVIDAAEKHAEAINRPLPYYNIETKSTAATDGIFHPVPKEFVDLLLKVFDEKKIADRVIVQSFDIRTLQYLRTIRPEIRTALLIEDFDSRTLTQQLQELGFTPSIYSPHYSLVTKELVKECKRIGIKVIPWTVNDDQAVKRLIQMGVDGMITDYPDKIKP